jgi:hypothetical protein
MLFYSLITQLANSLITIFKKMDKKSWIYYYYYYVYYYVFYIVLSYTFHFSRYFQALTSGRNRQVHLFSLFWVRASNLTFWQRKSFPKIDIIPSVEQKKI